MKVGAFAQATTPSTSRFGDAGRVLSLLRAGVGVGSWVSPKLTAHVFGLGSLNVDPRSAVITRLFGVRELSLAASVCHRDPQVRAAALLAGVIVDSVDVVATLVAVRNGAPKVILLTFAAGAAGFVALGVFALLEPQRMSRELNGAVT